VSLVIHKGEIVVSDQIKDTCNPFVCIVRHIYSKTEDKTGKQGIAGKSANKLKMYLRTVKKNVKIGLVQILVPAIPLQNIFYRKITNIFII